jgi:thiamine-monophosphate kinase
LIAPETPVGEIGERALLRHLRTRVPTGPGVEIGLGDDAAAVETGGLTLLTTDALVERTHFRREWTPARLLGRKALTINLSDVAAMAGVPRFALLSLCLPPDVTVGFVDALFDGLLERAAETGVSLVGGNLASTDGPIVVDVTLIGQGDRLLRRRGAAPGDLAVVTGSLGASAAGLRLLADGARLGDDGSLESSGLWTESSAEAVTHCLRAQLDPQPPLAFARALAEKELVHAAIDVSDGLSADLEELCRAGDLSARIERTAVPVDRHAAAISRARGGDALSLALHGGEDYELLMAIAPERLEELRDVATVWELGLGVVGDFAEGPAEVRDESGERVVPGGFEHFRSIAAVPRRAPVEE